MMAPSWQKSAQSILAVLLVNSFDPSADSAAAAFFETPERSRGCFRRTDSMLAQSSSTTAAGAAGGGPREFEIERKFELQGETDVSVTEEKLRELGFESKGAPLRFVDTYYDVAGPPWILTTRDCWLRYRELISSSSPRSIWQLKLGRSKNPGAANEKDAQMSTVYEEIQGMEALRTAASLLSEAASAAAVVSEDKLSDALHDASVLSESLGLFPFARFETTRSSWEASRESTGTVKVDLDSTDFGYRVGEVEMIVHEEAQVAEATQQVDSFLQQLGVTGRPPLGKLEMFLVLNHKEHYEACVGAGLMGLSKR